MEKLRSAGCRASVEAKEELKYAIQIQTSAWCKKIVNRCFGEPEQSESLTLTLERA
jgi:hypothetical protein